MATKAPAAVLDDEALVADVPQLSGVDDWRSAGVIARRWLVIALAGSVAMFLDRWWLALAAIVVAAKQHALGVIFHDATHCRVFTSRFVNEYVGSLFCACPFGMSIQRCRGDHQAHHLWTNTRAGLHVRIFDEDTAWYWPKSRGVALWQAVADVSGFNTLHVQGTLVERVFIAPLDVDFHSAHQLFPAVPPANLRHVHQRRLQHPARRREAERYRDYLGSADSVRVELIADRP